MHKLSSPWEGPFEVIEVTRPTSYRLAHLDGIEYPTLGILISLGVSTYRVHK
jgi:hypothetical protein